MQHESERNPAGGVNERERPCSAPATLQARATLFRATVASGLLVGRRESHGMPFCFKLSHDIPADPG